MVFGAINELFAKIMNPVFRPLLSLPPIWVICILAFIVSIIIILITKWKTDQDLMKRLKDELKQLQKEMKELRAHPEEAMKVNKKVMEANMKYMKESFRPMLWTLLPVMLILPWMIAHYAYVPIRPGEQFRVILTFEEGTTGNVETTIPDGITAISPVKQEIENDKAIFTYKGEEGDYTEGKSILFTHNDKKFYKDIIITEEQEYAKKDEPIGNSELKTISIDYSKLEILPVLNWGWLGTYFVFSIIFTIALRKLMKVY